MPVTTDDKQQSKSATLPVSQLTIKKTLSLTSSQCTRPLTDKLSSGNFSSVFKLKVPRHSQDRESDVLFKSYGQSNAREIGNFQQGHRKQRKIQESVGATKSGSYKRQIMNRQQPHATLESEREKLETEEDKLGNCHNDPDHNVDTAWYKSLWQKWKKQAKKIANADADSSSDESVSNKTRVTKQPSGSTRNKHGKILVSDKNFIFPSSEGLMIESWEKVSYRKMIHVPPIDVFQPKQNSTTHFKLPVFRITTSEKTGEKPEEGREVTRLRPEQILSLLSNNWINVLPEEVRRNFINRLKSIYSEDSVAHFKLLVDIITTSEKTGEKPVEDFKLLPDITTSSEKSGEKLVENYRDYRMQDRFADIAQKQIKWKGDVINLDGLKTLKSKAVEKLLANNRDYRMQDRFADIAQKQTKLKRDVTNLINVLPEEVRRNFLNRSKSKRSKDSVAHFKLLVDRMTTSEKTGEKPEEDFKLLAYSTTSLEKIENFLEINVLPEEVRRNFLNRSKSKRSKNSTTHFKLPVFRITTSEKTVEKPEEGGFQTSQYKAVAKLFENGNNEEWCDTQEHVNENNNEGKEVVEENHEEKEENLVTSQNLDMPTTQDQIQDEINVLPERVRRNFFNRSKSIHSKLKNEAADKRSTVESTRIRLYRNIIRNETSRMMSSIGMVRFEAEHLFGLERSRIFFDLLDEELCHFGSAGAISEFVPNMAESTVRQHVISFFEHANNTMSRLMTLLLRCSDNKILQQMPVHNFISLMKSVIKSSLKAHTKGREKLALEGNIYTMVDPKNFEKELGEEIPEDVLNRLRSKDEMVVQRFVDTRQERHQPSDTREISPIHYTVSSCIYFPSDCRLYIYIPTENGSYWHQSDMRRGDGISRHGK